MMELCISSISHYNRGIVSESERLTVMADLLAYPSRFSCLFCDEFMPEHLSSVCLNFSRAINIMDGIATTALNPTT